MSAQPKPCPATTNADEDIAQMRKDIHEIKKALVGDEEFGQIGLFKRMRAAEKLIYLVIIALIIIGGDRAVAIILR